MRQLGSEAVRQLGSEAVRRGWRLRPPMEEAMLPGTDGTTEADGGDSLLTMESTNQEGEGTREVAAIRKAL